MLKTKKLYITTLVLFFVLVISSSVNAFASMVDGHDILGYDNIRTVFVNDCPEGIEIQYLIDRDGVLYIPLAYTLNLSPANTSYIYKTSEDEKSCTIEQTDRYSWTKGYFTVWRNSKKLRISGYDDTLTYTPIFMSRVDLFGNSSYVNVVYISIDDFTRIYGLDKNYWKEKNTIYFSRNGNGLLQKYKASEATKKTTAKPSVSNSQSKASYSSSSTYPGTSVPNFTAVTGISCSSKTGNSYVYKNVSRASLNQYLSHVSGKGFSRDGVGRTYNAIDNGDVEYAVYVNYSNMSAFMIDVTYATPMTVTISPMM